MRSFTHSFESLFFISGNKVTEYSDADHRLIVDVLTCFIRKDGRRAAELLIDDTNARNSTDQAQAEELYIEKMAALTARAHGKDYFMEQLGTYISYICEAAATHHVMMNQAFVSAALAVKIQEGIALGKSARLAALSIMTHKFVAHLIVFSAGPRRQYLPHC